MKFKEWFLAWPDYVIQNSTFTCFGGPQKWHFFIDENENPECTVDSLRKDIEEGWGPANYDISYIENVFPSSEDEYESVNLHFYIYCFESKNDTI